jgi:V-containing nitrogenase delta subunit
MNEKIDQLATHIQERCLWQFFSRTWDREENIEGILSRATEILCGERSVISTPADKSHYADAKILVSDFKRLYPWVATMEKQDIKTLLQGVKERIH